MSIICCVRLSHGKKCQTLWFVQFHIRLIHLIFYKLDLYWGSRQNFIRTAVCLLHHYISLPNFRHKLPYSEKQTGVLRLLALYACSYSIKAKSKSCALQNVLQHNSKNLLHCGDPILDRYFISHQNTAYQKTRKLCFTVLLKIFYLALYLLC